MDKGAHRVLKVLGSKKRQKILAHIKDGLDHPEDIAKAMGATRQSIDKQVDLMCEIGVVTKEATTPPSGRPRVVLVFTPCGATLLHDLKDVVILHFKKLEKEYTNALEDLDDDLLSGRMSEKAYKEKKDQLSKRFSIVKKDD